MMLYSWLHPDNVFPQRDHAVPFAGDGCNTHCSDQSLRQFAPVILQCHCFSKPGRYGANYVQCFDDGVHVPKRPVQNWSWLWCQDWRYSLCLVAFHSLLNYHLQKFCNKTPSHFLHLRRSHNQWESCKSKLIPLWRLELGLCKPYLQIMDFAAETTLSQIDFDALQQQLQTQEAAPREVPVYADGVQVSQVAGDVIRWRKDTETVERFDAQNYIRDCESEIASLRNQVRVQASDSNTEDKSCG